MRLTVSLAAACLVALALVAACSPRDGSAAASGAAAQNTKTGGTASPSQTQTPAPQDDGVRRFAQEELRAALEKGGDAVAVFDVRDKASYAAGHIKGAKLVPWDQVEHRLGEFPKDRLIVTYCA